MSEDDRQAELIEALLSFKQGGAGGAESPPGTNDTAAGRTADPDAQLTEVGQAIDTLHDEIDRIDDRSHDRAETIYQTIQELSGDVSALQERLDAAPEDDVVSELEESLDRLSEALTAVQDQNERQFDAIETEFDDLEATLLQLVERITANRQASAENAESIASIKPALAVIKQRQALSELQDRANQAGATVADCHSCGNRVDISLLSKPACPQCGVDFEDVETESGWWRTTHTLI